MKLAAYLAQENLSPSQFADRLGVPASTVSRILQGEREPRLGTIAKIREATNGLVTANDFMEPRPEPAPTEAGAPR